MLAAADVGLVFLDGHDRVAFANQQFGEIFGLREHVRGLPRGELERRLRERAGHFMAVDMLGSQLATLEVPDADEALVLDGVRPVPELVRAIVSTLGC